MPLEDIQAVLAAPDPETRSRVFSAHLDRLEEGLSRTQEAVTSLRELLEQPPGIAQIGHRRLAETTAAAVTETVDKSEALVWYQGALGELQATLTAQRLEPTGAAGGIFADKLFAEDRGEATIFVPCASKVRPMGRVAPILVPGAELATLVHAGSHVGIDRAYGALGGYVAQHAVAMDGPIREYYLVGPIDTDDESLWRTEVGWPIFQTRPVD
jgi:effector-binding domain-containing protein